MRNALSAFAVLCLISMPTKGSDYIQKSIPTEGDPRAESLEDLESLEFLENMTSEKLRKYQDIYTSYDDLSLEKKNAISQRVSQGGPDENIGVLQKIGAFFRSIF